VHFPLLIHGIFRDEFGNVSPSSLVPNPPTNPRGKTKPLIFSPQIYLANPRIPRVCVNLSPNLGTKSTLGKGTSPSKSVAILNFISAAVHLNYFRYKTKGV
jgi:hypothetical protein